MELSVSYDQGPWSAYANAAWSQARGKNIVTSQFNFDPGDLAYIAGHYIHLDHDQTWTGSVRLAWTMDNGADRTTRFSGDLLLPSGLRATAPNGSPNGTALPGRAVLNLSVAHRLPSKTGLRLDVINVGDSVYKIRDGSGVGVGAPQFGLRRAILAGVTQRF